MGGRAFETLRVTATGVLDLFGRMAGRVGGVRAKMSALAKVEPGATLLLPAANMKNGCPLDEDGKVVRATQIYILYIYIYIYYRLDPPTDWPPFGPWRSNHVAGKLTLEFVRWSILRRCWCVKGRQGP